MDLPGWTEPISTERIRGLRREQYDWVKTELWESFWYARDKRAGGGNEPMDQRPSYPGRGIVVENFYFFLLLYYCFRILINGNKKSN